MRFPYVAQGDLGQLVDVCHYVCKSTKNLQRERGGKNRTICATKYQLHYFAVLKIKE